MIVVMQEGATEDQVQAMDAMVREKLSPVFGYK